MCSLYCKQRHGKHNISVTNQENVLKLAKTGDQMKRQDFYFLTDSQLPTLNLACCPEARNDTNTNCCPRTRTPIFLLSDRKSGLRGVGVSAWSVQLQVLILLPLSSRLRPPQASILNLLHRKQEQHHSRFSHLYVHISLNLIM